MCKQAIGVFVLSSLGRKTSNGKQQCRNLRHPLTSEWRKYAYQGVEKINNAQNCQTLTNQLLD